MQKRYHWICFEATLSSIRKITIFASHRFNIRFTNEVTNFLGYVVEAYSWEKELKVSQFPAHTTKAPGMAGGG